MELSQEHFDKQFEELNKRLDNMATKAELADIRSEMATKAELESIRAGMATKADLTAALENQTQQLEAYTDSVAATIIEAVDNRFIDMEKVLTNRIERLETTETDIRKIKKALRLSA